MVLIEFWANNRQAYHFARQLADEHAAMRLTKYHIHHSHQRNEQIIFQTHIINAIHFNSVNELRPIEMPFFSSQSTFIRLLKCQQFAIRRLIGFFLFVLHRKYDSSRFSLYILCVGAITQQQQQQKITLSKFDVGNDWFHSEGFLRIVLHGRRERERKMMKMPSSRHTGPHFVVFVLFFFGFFSFIHSPQNVQTHQTFAIFLLTHFLIVARLRSARFKSPQKKMPSSLPNNNDKLVVSCNGFALRLAHPMFNCSVVI